MLKSKFLAIFFIILILLNIFTSYSSAFVIKDDTKLLDFGDIDDQLLNYTFCYHIVISGNNWYRLYTTTNEMRSLSPTHGGWELKNAGLYHQWDLIELSDGSFQLADRGEKETSGGLITDNVSFANDYIYSSYDMYNGNALVFQKPVLTLGEALAMTNPVKTFQTMMPGMILSLVAFLVLLVGFLKAWSILSNSLRKA